MEILEYVKLAMDFLIVPLFGMVWSAQGRLSRMEGEIKALYSIIDLISNRGHNERRGD